MTLDGLVDGNLLGNKRLDHEHSRVPPGSDSAWRSDVWEFGV